MSFIFDHALPSTPLTQFLTEVFCSHLRDSSFLFGMFSKPHLFICMKHSPVLLLK